MEKLIAGARRLGMELSAKHIATFERYYNELVAWNQRFNLTAIVEREQVQTRHFLDSLTVALAFPPGPRPSFRLLDVGAGAGFPGLPLKIVYPGIQLTLLEATRKKADFLAHVAAALGLAEVEVVCERAEEAAHRPGHRESYDVVVSRAVAAMPALAELTLPFCRVGGAAVAQKKGQVQDQVQAAPLAIKTLGGEMRECLRLSVPELGEDDRFLVIVDKVAPTPARYPRRPGVPQKRPLGHGA